MAPTRHGTAGAGQPDSDDIPPTYGTRSKRKAADITEDEQSNSQDSKKTSPVAAKKQKTVEPKTSPIIAKKRIGGQRSQPAKKSESVKSTTPEEEPSSKSSSVQSPPEIALDVPSGTSEEPTSQNPSPNKGGWVEPPAMETELPPSMPISPRKGGFRGRGSTRGGRGGRGRGGRPPKNASGRGTPAPSNGIVKVGRGGGRGRARKQTSAELKAVFKRKDDLKQLYRAIAQQQKLALSVIAEQSLDKVTEDRNYHKTLPEYETMMTRLDLIRDGVINELDVRARAENASAKLMYDGHVLCENKIFQNKIDLIYEKYVNRILDQSTYVHVQSNNRAPLDEIPFSKGELGRLVKEIKMPAKVVHPFGTAKFMDSVLAGDFESGKGNPRYKQDPKFYKTIGDNDFEQHPANHYLMLTKEGRRAFEESEKQEIDSMKKEKGRKKVTNKDSLFSKTATVLDEEPGNEDDQAAEEIPDVAINPSQSDDDDNPLDNAPEQPEDEFGCSVPNKRGRGKAANPNNRIVTPAYSLFDENPENEANGDIGIRVHMFKNINGDMVDVGRDISPNPKHFHLNQVVSYHNSAKNKPGDLDENLVKQYNVHPTFGVGIMESVNPDVDDQENPTFGPKTRRDGPHPKNRCTTFIHEDRKGNKTITYTSKTQASSQAFKDGRYTLAQIRLRKLLVESGDFKNYMPEPEPEGVIDPQLVKAVEDAKAEETRKNLAPIPEPVVIPAPPVFITPQRTGHYDPVRDSTTSIPYQTPYAQPGQQSSRIYSAPPPPVVHPPGHLGALAQAAELLKAADLTKASEIASYADRRRDSLPPPPSMVPGLNNPFSSHPTSMHVPVPIPGSMQGPMQSAIQSSMPSPMQGHMGPPSSIMHASAPYQQQYQNVPYSYYNRPPPPPPPPQFPQQAQHHPQQPQQMQQQSPRMGHAPPIGAGLRELRPAVAKSRAVPQPQSPQAAAPSWSPYGAPPNGPR